ncbi:hypothetical protein HDU98_004017 [Podochytrium sp. JEL0797]|nr:hypothetical protein HDU98_004017 [Podochytrium sp. JEL0797]
MHLINLLSLAAGAPLASAYFLAGRQGHYNHNLTPAQIQAAIACSTAVLTQQGETCGSIAADNSMAFTAFTSMNPTLSCQNGLPLPPNTLVCVASPDTANAPTAVSCDVAYGLRATDTCESVSAAFSLGATNQAILNQGLDCFDTVDFVGKQFCLEGHFPGETVHFGGPPSKVSVSAAASATATIDQFQVSANCSTLFSVESTNSTCLDIVASFANVSITELALWNTGIPCWSLSQGDQICVGGIPPAIPSKPVLPSSTASASISISASLSTQDVSASAVTTQVTTTLATTTASTTQAIPTTAPTTTTTASTTIATTAAPSPTPFIPQPGTVASIITQDAFDSAAQNCGIYDSTLYPAMVKGFTAPLSGLHELAILMGNCAHESVRFTATSEFGCSTDPSSCPYGNYYGRGYLQLTWKQNYQAAADFLGRQDIVDNPNVVAYDGATNWATVDWFWANAVQPNFKSNGVSLATSVQIVNGYIECQSMGGKGINGDRASQTQCFENQFGVSSSYETSC